jgi:hypothetical protein
MTTWIEDCLYTLTWPQFLALLTLYAALMACAVYQVIRRLDRPSPPQPPGGGGLPDEPVPYWPADTLDALATAVTCPLCTPGGHGTCHCTADCGHPACTYDHTSMATLTAADMRWLRSQSIKGEK